MEDSGSSFSSSNRLSASVVIVFSHCLSASLVMDFCYTSGCIREMWFVDCSCVYVHVYTCEVVVITSTESPYVK